MKVTNYVASWFARADEDLQVIEIVLQENGPNNLACFHAQQAAEKYLKGFLAYKEKHARKIHDIEMLLEVCKSIDSSFEKIQDDAIFLGRFYVKSRYPDDYVEFYREDAEKALEAAKRIKEFVLSKVETLSKFT